jgi:hypothetical protein
LLLRESYILNICFWENLTFLEESKVWNLFLCSRFPLKPFRCVLNRVQLLLSLKNKKNHFQEKFLDSCLTCSIITMKAFNISKNCFNVKTSFRIQHPMLTLKLVFFLPNFSIFNNNQIPDYNCQSEI